MAWTSAVAPHGTASSASVQEGKGSGSDRISAEQDPARGVEESSSESESEACHDYRHPHAPAR